MEACLRVKRGDRRVVECEERVWNNGLGDGRIAEGEERGGKGG